MLRRTFAAVHLRATRAACVGTVAALAIAGFMPAACSRKDYTRLYHTESHAPSLTDGDVISRDHLGPTLVDRGVNFGVYSAHATRVELLLFDDPEADHPTKRFPMTQLGDVWSLYVEGIGVGQHYGYIAFGPNWPYDPAWFPGSIKGFVADVDAAGNRFNPNKLLADPYGKALHRDHDWSKGSAASGPKRTESTWAAAAKNVVVASTYNWSANESTWRENRKKADNPGHNWNQLIIYEAHPKGFTMESASGATHPGTFRGIGEKADYFADLGINAVELMPVAEKPLDGGYWGYWTINWFAPEITYSSTHDPLLVVDEFKWMVDELHKRNIEVLLDVVYNHTGEGGLWRDRQYTNDVSLDPTVDGAVNVEPKEVATIYSERGLDNSSYYALQPDNQTYWNNTGVGQEMRANFTPTRKLIMDSLHWWQGDLHVDGFRFDLAGVLGEQDGNYNYWDNPANTVLQDIIDDPQLQETNTRIIAEPWTAGGTYGSLIGAYPNSTAKDGTGWGEWNGHFRDWWRDFVNNDAWALNSTEGATDGGATLTGSANQYQYNGRKPYHSVNYVTCHDGMTMYDLVSYNTKNNACGPLNPVCCTAPTSAWCEAHNGDDNNRSRDWGPIGDLTAEKTKRQMMRGMFTAMLIAHGTPMLFAGDEWMRTQYGNNNAYSTGADNEWNWLRWGEWQPDPARNRMHDFVRQLTRFRKSHEYALAPLNYGGGAAFTWKSPANTTAVNWSGRALMIDYEDPAKGKPLLILINMERAATDFTLPAGTWKRLIDTQNYFDDPDVIASQTLDPMTSHNATIDAPVLVMTPDYNVPGSAIVVLEGP